MNVLEYKGYIGSIETCLHKKNLYGKILYINDLVTFSGDTVPELEAEFKNAVDDYLIICEELGAEPDKTFKGSLNVRLGNDLHRQVAYQAERIGIKINDFIKKACEEKLTARDVINLNVTHITRTSTTQDVVFGQEASFSYASKSISAKNFDYSSKDCH